MSEPEETVIDWLAEAFIVFGGLFVLGLILVLAYAAFFRRP